jgi:hypothetical protein
MRHLTLSIVVVLALVGGCTASAKIDAGDVRASDRDTPFAIWLPPDRSSAPAESTRELVLKVLRAEGLHPEFKEPAVTVPPDEESRAREVLVTSPELKGLPLFIFCSVAAGTASKTPVGFDVPKSAIIGDVYVPTTAPSQ